LLYALECYAGAIFRLDIAVIQSTDNLLGRCGVEALTVPRCTQLPKDQSYQ